MAGSRLKVAAVLVLVIAFQECVVPFFHILGAYPDVVVGFAVVAGLVGGAQNGAIIGFCAGMSLDLFLQTPFGLSALVYTLVGFAAGSLQSVLPMQSRLMMSLATGIASAVGVIAFELLGALLGQTAMLKVSLGVAVLVVAVFNVIIGIPLVWLTRWTKLQFGTNTTGYQASQRTASTQATR